MAPQRDVVSTYVGTRVHLLNVPNTSGAERCAYIRRPQRLFYALNSSGGREGGGEREKRGRGRNMQEGRKGVGEGGERKGEDVGREGGRKGTTQQRDTGCRHETAVHSDCGKTGEEEVVWFLPRELSPTGENWMTPRALKSRVPSRADYGHMGADSGVSGNDESEEEEEGLFKANAVNEVDAERDCAGSRASMNLSREALALPPSSTREVVRDGETSRRKKIVSWSDSNMANSPFWPAKPEQAYAPRLKLAATPPLGNEREVRAKENEGAIPRRTEPFDSYAPTALSANMYSLTAEEDEEIERLLAGADPRLPGRGVVDEGISGERSWTSVGASGGGSGGGKMSLPPDDSDSEVLERDTREREIDRALALLDLVDLEFYPGSELEAPPGPKAP